MKIPDLNKFPIKVSLETLPADVVKKYLNFIVKEYTGTEIYQLDDDLNVIEKPITQKDFLKDGMLVSAWNEQFTVRKNGEYFCLESGDTTGFLSFDEDDRHCWVCDGLCNKRGLSKLSIKT